MGVMVVVVVVAVVLAVALGFAWLVRRRGDDEVQSVEGYRHAISTLEDIRSRSAGRGGGGIGPPGVDQGATGDGSASLAPTGRSEGEPWPGSYAGSVGPAPGDRLVARSRVSMPTGRRRFDDATTAGPPLETPLGSGRAQRRAMSTMNHGPRRVAGPVLAVALVLVAAVALAVIGARHHPRHASTATTASSGTQSSTATTTHSAKKRAHHGTSPSSTTTPAPTQFQPQAGASAGAATYVPPTASYTVTVVAANGDCWVQVNEVASGSTVYASTLPAGQTASLPLTGASTLVLGAPGAAQVTLDQETVVLPSGYQAPFTITFQPPGTT
jgi:hypothetical protein